MATNFFSQTQNTDVSSGSTGGVAIGDINTVPLLDKLPDADQIHTAFDNVVAWVSVNVLSVSTIGQAAATALTAALSVLVANRLAKWSDTHPLGGPRLSAYLSRFFHLSRHEFLLLFFMPLFLWTAALIAAAAGLPFAFINAAALLVFVWSTIRITSALINSALWAKTVAVFLWVVAALIITGWMPAVINVLDSAAITIGRGRLSLLMVINGAIFMTILLWITGIVTRSVDRTLEKSTHFSPSQKVLLVKICKISLFVLSLLIGLNIVGLDFTTLALFSGALGIGIGFGLQKIFANLISGFILLMDKSIKPGDVIAVNDTYGWVNRLGTRYVSILTRDGKEHLIPNEVLITERVENWSYSKSQVRLHCALSVSYKSDRKLVKELMLAAVKGNKRILEYPQPICLLLGFGENGLNFELRFWIDDPANGVNNIRSAVYEAIWDLFQEHNIKVPYAQRDVHLYEMGPWKKPLDATPKD